MSKTLKVHITGEATIYRNDKWGYPVYKAKLSSQNADGEWDYCEIQVGLPKGKELSDGTEIKINDGFFSFFTKKDGTKEHKIIIRSYDIMNQAVGDIDVPTDNTVNFETELPW